MTEHIQLPVKVVGKYKWAALSSIASAHLICAEKVNKIEDNFTFAGGHRVRLYKFKNNVHWRIDKGFDVDIAGVDPKQAPRRSG